MRSVRAFAQASARVALGLLIVWQLLFLLGTNLLDAAGAIRRARERGDEDKAPAWMAGEEELPRLLRRPHGWAGDWAELSGQEQRWALFAPSVTDIIPFLAVELRWYGPHPKSAVLLSDNEPADRRSFFRFGKFRLRRYESTFDVVPAGPSSENWDEAIRLRVPEDGPRLRAFLRWRLRAYQRDRPDLPPPDEVLLWGALSKVPAPPGPVPWDWEDLSQNVLARWRPALGDPPGSAPVEVYDPIRGRFEWAGAR
jgi:hypothetical protein